MVDLGAFAEESFQAKAWVNDVCKQRRADDSIDRYLADVEMKLQLMAEDIAGALEEQSVAALLRMPRALRDVVRLRDDALGLRSTVSGISLKLEQVGRMSAESVAALARVDKVKQRMEAAHETLQDAAGLAQLSASVEDVFASGDLPRAAETLANMRRCLAVVGEVPEFANVKRQLEVLEDRLEGMVQPQLSDALSERKVESTQGLRDILITIGRYGSLEQHYTRVRVRPLRRLWEEFESGKGAIAAGKLVHSEKQTSDRHQPAIAVANGASAASFSAWLPRFYDEVLLQLELEYKWCQVAFAEDYNSLVPKVLIETMSAISASFTARVDAATEEAIVGTKGSASESGGDKGRGTKMGILLALHSMTGAFAKNVQHLFSAVDIMEVAHVLRAVYSPFETYKQRYGELEQSQLIAEVTALDLRGAVPRGIGARGVELSETVRRMEASIPAVTLALEGAVERCTSFTGGSEAEALVHALDEVMLHYLASLVEILNSLRQICGVDRSAPDGQASEVGFGRKDSGLGLNALSAAELVPEEEEWAIVQGALQLLTVGDSLSGRSSVFEVSLRATLVRLGTRLQLTQALASGLVSSASSPTGSANEEFGPSWTLDMAILRLFDAPEKARRLASLFEQTKDPRFHALPHTSQRVAAFTEAVNDLVYEVLISKVRLKLADVARLPVWSAVEEDNDFELPSFSDYPLPYVTSIGEYLFTLPQQLEPLGGGGSGGASETGEDHSEEAQYFATEWMFKVAEGATALYIEQIRGIQLLSDRGAQQLSADIEYLCNVLSALSMATPGVLATFQACVSLPRPKLLELVKQDGGAQLDMPTVRLVCKMRQVSLDH